MNHVKFAAGFDGGDEQFPRITSPREYLPFSIISSGEPFKAAETK